MKFLMRQTSPMGEKKKHSGSEELIPETRTHRSIDSNVTRERADTGSFEKVSKLKGQLLQQ